MSTARQPRPESAVMKARREARAATTKDRVLKALETRMQVEEPIDNGHESTDAELDEQIRTARRKPDPEPPPQLSEMEEAIAAAIRRHFAARR
jgi:hypothetical protein